jgi:hypothetical protein
MSTTGDIGNLILGEAAKVPGETWTKIQQAAKLYVNGYSQNLLDIAQGVVDGDLTPDEGKMNAINAQLLLEMGIANTSEIVLNEVQQFINNVIGILKTAINSKLPIPIL